MLCNNISLSHICKLGQKQSQWTLILLCSFSSKLICFNWQDWLQFIWVHLLDLKSATWWRYTKRTSIGNSMVQLMRNKIFCITPFPHLATLFFSLWTMRSPLLQALSVHWVCAVHTALPFMHVRCNKHPLVTTVPVASGRISAPFAPFSCHQTTINPFPHML